MRGDYLACYRPNYTYFVDGSFAGFGGRLSQAALDNHYEGTQVVPVPCGKCCGCRLDRSKSWADRMLLEYATTRDRVKPKTALFITLTYDDSHLRFINSFDGVPLPTLHLHDFQLFVKTLRNHFTDRKIRYYYAGEYGDNTFRPHYHMILYGFDFNDFPDFVLYSHDNELGTDLFTSNYLDSLWSLGSVKFSAANYSTFCYVGRYIIKKQFGVDKMRYGGRVPPFSHCSKRPALGSDFFSDLSFDRVSLSDGCDVHTIKIPRVVLDRLKLSDPETYEALIEQRRFLSQARHELLISRLDKPYFDYLHDAETNYYNKRKILGRRGKV